MARSRSSVPATELVRGVQPEALTPAAVRREFRARLATGATLVVPPAGAARRRRVLLAKHLPRHVVRLFGTSFYLGDMLFDDHIGFLIGYVAPSEGRKLFARAFYKDSSLLWRVASHVERHGGSLWIGKGDTRVEERDGWEYHVTAEETTNLPLELQAAFDEVSRRRKRRRDDHAIELASRRAPRGRVRPFADFSGPRARAARAWRVNGGRAIARFRRPGVPESLVFAPGFAPDLARGVVEKSRAHSAYFGGPIEKVRVLSRNRAVQYLFFASPKHVWLAPPQPLTTALSSFGVRVHEVRVPEELVVPGYEYHSAEESQIPAGFAGAFHPTDPDRADAGPWLARLPLVREFRRRIGLPEA
jgi:hypothetical protein